MGALKCANLMLEGQDKEMLIHDIAKFINESPDWKWTSLEDLPEDIAFWQDPQNRICTAFETDTFGDRDWFHLLGSYLETITADKDIKMLCWWDCAEWGSAGYWYYDGQRFKFKTRDGVSSYEQVCKWLRKQTGLDVS